MLVSFMKPYLALCDCPQGLNDAQLDIETGCVVQETHNNLHHLCDGLLELAMLLAENLNLLIQE